MANVSRRNFFKALTSGVLGISLAKNVRPGLKETRASQGEPSPIKIQKYNTLGKTGIKVPDVSCGAISFFEPNVLRYAYELGVTYFDTAEGYMRTKSETFIGQALKEMRDKVIITTKHPYSPRMEITKENVIKRLEASLKRMQTDYIDIHSRK
jgi:diketogulonate reductase-like aldo/keto reductase